MEANRFENFAWMNPSQMMNQDGRLVIVAHPHSDFFINIDTNVSTHNAAFLFTNMLGDFVLRAKVTHEFISFYDACALMYYEDERHWGKLCLEYTDIPSHTVVSVVANGLPDDANGADIAGNSTWLQLARKGKAFSMHYSTDGIRYNMVRHFTASCDALLKVGFVAQSPVGEGGQYIFENIELSNTTLADIRKGT